MTSPQWEYAKGALECPGDNLDLRYCIGLPSSENCGYTKAHGNRYRASIPHHCYTTTSIELQNCNKIMADPAKWGIHEVSSADAVPGDMVLFITCTLEFTKLKSEEGEPRLMVGIH